VLLDVAAGCATLYAMRTILVALSWLAVIAAQPASAQPLATPAEAPLPPCAAAASGGPAEDPQPYPAFAPEDAVPSTAVWHDIDLSEAQACGGRLQGHLSVVVAMSGQFRFAGSLDDLAARAGAVSKIVGLQYWSASEQKWRALISEGSAVTGPDGDWKSGKLWRPDFTAAEVRSGDTLWFQENDTRSTGANLYRLRALPSVPDSLALEVVNESPIEFTFVTLFGEHELLSLHVVQHLEGDLWGYYGLAATRDKTFDDYDKSLLNRAHAFFRFLQGKPGDAGPPLAR